MHRRVFPLLFLLGLLLVIYVFQKLSLNESNALIAEKRLTECVALNNNQERYDCGKSFIESYYKVSDSNVLVNALRLTVLKNGEAGASMCHPYSELIGSVTSIDLGFDALDNLQYSCLGGFIHGVFYRLGLEYPASVVASKSIGVCESFSAGKPWVAGWDCRHGVGHAISEDPNISVNDMINLCEDVYSTDHYRVDCFSGVVGGLVERLVKPKTFINGVSEKPWEFCYELRDIYKSVCLQRSGLLASTYYSELEKILNICPDGDKDCFYGLGFYIGLVSLEIEPSRRVELCKKLGEDGFFPCLSGVIRSITPEFWLLGLDPGICKVTTAKEYCENEQRVMRERELSIEQIYNNKEFKVLSSDPAAWPIELRS